MNLTASNAEGSDTFVRTGYITVSGPDPAVADFTADVQAGFVPLTVNFTDTSGGECLTGYQWVFGDNPDEIFTDRNITHTFTAPGTYFVNHSATNILGTSWKNETAYITATVAPPVVLSIKPARHVRNGKAFSAVLTGTGFQPGVVGTNVTLTKGGKNIKGNQVNAISTTELTCRFRIREGARTGFYRLTVENPDGQTGTLKNAFKVLEGRPIFYHDL